MTPGAMVSAARTLLPEVKRIAIVGGNLRRGSLLRPVEEKRSALPAGLELIDLVGLPMAELQRRVAVSKLEKLEGDLPNRRANGVWA
jgi:hypothetical protein